MLTRNDFIGLKPTIERVEIDGLGEVYVRAMSAKERDYYELQNAQLDAGEGWSYRAYAALRCCCDKEGVPLFIEDDLPILQELPYQILDEIWVKAATLSALTPESGKTAKKKSKRKGSGTDSE